MMLSLSHTTEFNDTGLYRINAQKCVFFRISQRSREREYKGGDAASMGGSPGGSQRQCQAWMVTKFL